MNILLSGSLAYDRIMDYPGVFAEHILPEKIHALNVSFNIDRLIEKRGGTAGNIAYSLALLGKQPHVIGSVGKDFAPYYDFLHQKGIQMDAIERHDDVLTAVAHIMTDRTNNQITGFYMGAMEQETHADLKKYNATESILVLSAGNKADMLRYKKEAMTLGMRVMFDPGQTLNWLTGDELRMLIPGSAVCVLNDYELELVKERTGWSEDEIAAAVDWLIVTLGKEGARLRSKTETVVVPAAKAGEIKDPTGAGDAFRAGVLKGMTLGSDMETCGRLGVVAAIYAIEQYGTQEHTYTKEEFCARYQENFSHAYPIA